ncbi:MAG: hypothetical protein V1793_00560 [Pseudomonadota bacterium]
MESRRQAARRPIPTLPRAGVRVNVKQFFKIDSHAAEDMAALMVNSQIDKIRLKGS